MDQRIYQEDLANLLGVEVRTLRQWRLKEFEGKDLYLPAHRDSKITQSYYFLDEVIEFCKRNPKYGERLIAVTAPDAVQAAFVAPPLLPQARSKVISNELRGTTTQGTGRGLMSPIHP